MLFLRRPARDRGRKRGHQVGMCGWGKGWTGSEQGPVSWPWLRVGLVQWGETEAARREPEDFRHLEGGWSLCVPRAAVASLRAATCVARAVSREP